VAEAIHCPSCTTRYRLRPERLKPVIRRAKCFSCGSVFPVGDVVRRLLALPTEELPADSAPNELDALDAMDAALQDELDHAQTLTPSLTLDDLDNTDPGLPERALVAAPEAPPEARVAAGRSYPVEITDTTLSGYTSARDAIDKLFGPPPGTDLALHINPDTNTMDLEATLAAFEDTLGTSTGMAPATSIETPDDRPMASALGGSRMAEPSSSTISLSQEDIRAALAAAPALPPVPTPAPASAEPIAPRVSEVTAPAEERILIARPTSPRSFDPLPDAPNPGEEMLRLKIGEEIYTGLTMQQLIAWVEEGRILENHLVARQHSENWLEAQKVPGLRPVFERLRRERSNSATGLDSGFGDQAPKKSLFGGLFGKS
jgi:predicted Zn finger-like uncharacterized protein